MQIHRKHHRVIRTAHHRLLAGPPPDQEISVYSRDVLLHPDVDRIRDHFGRSKSISVAASRHGDAVCIDEQQIRIGVVAVSNRERILLCRRVVSERLCTSGEVRHHKMLCTLLQDPVVALLGGSALNGLKIMVRRNAVVFGDSCGAGSELLLILPDDDLRRKRIIVIIRSGNRGIQTLLPAVYRCEHNALACGSRQILKISAVAAAG